MNEREYFGIAKVAAYTVILLAAGYGLFRLVVGPLWGSASNLGMIGAVAALAAGILGLAWLALFFFRDAMKHFGSESEP